MSPVFENDHNVYVLGAGFGVDAGLPTVQGFLSRMRDASDYLAATGQNGEAQAIARVLAFRETAASAAHRTQIDIEDVEELFSLASADGGDSLHEDMRLAIAATLEFCHTSALPNQRMGSLTMRNEFLGSSQLSKTAWTVRSGETGFSKDVTVFDVQIHDQYAAAMLGRLGEQRANSRNTFISFNYDLLLEDAFKRLHVDVDYGINPTNMTTVVPWVRPGNGVQILKLHGSVNWAFPGKRGKRMTTFDSYQAVRGAGLVPVLIPPTWRKDFGYSQLDQVWTAAVRALRTATRIIVIGFSLPRNDLHFRYLLSAGLRQNISLRRMIFVDPSMARVRQRALKVLRPELVRQQTLSFLERRAEDFLLSRAHLEQIGRPSEVQILSLPAPGQSLMAPRWA